MKNLILVAALMLGASMAMATDVDLAVQDDMGAAMVTVSPGATVNYQIVGTLTDNANEGLALFGLDLMFDGGDLMAADIPTGAPMQAFASGPGTSNMGINNPQGFGGTVIGGDLIQIGGGQNTIMNPGPPSYPEYPLGPVVTGVAWSQQVLVTGSLTAPMTEGVYTLAVDPATFFANVIKQGEDGNPFWATEAAGLGSLTNLTINVTAASCILEGSDPMDGAIDARRPHVPGDPGATEGWDSIVLTFNTACDAGTLSIGEFTISEDCVVGDCDGMAPSIAALTPAGNVLTVDFDRPLDPKTWTTIEINGQMVTLGFLPGDTDSSSTANLTDILALIDYVNNGTGVVYQKDIDRSGTTNLTDILVEIDVLNGQNFNEAFLGKQLP